MANDEFRTPLLEIYNPLNEIFDFKWDCACDEDNCLVTEQRERFKEFAPYDYLYTNLLDYVDEGETIWANPPYSRKLIGKFIRKLWEDSKHFRVVMLLKADMSTKWFNYALEQNDNRGIYTQYQGNDNISDALFYLENNMKENCDIREGVYRQRYQIGILHLRNRVKFYVSEEVFSNDSIRLGIPAPLADSISVEDFMRAQHTIKPGTTYEIYNGPTMLIETKNYRRVEDGIVSKAGANFPSMIRIFDRRNEGL